MNHINKATKAKCLLAALVVLSFIFIAPPLFAKELVVIYPRPQSESDTRDNDVVELLRFALQKTVDSYGPFKMKPSIRMKEGRYKLELKKGRTLNVIWATVTEELEKELLPIRIPVRKGILGYRIFLIRKQDQEKFAAIDTLEELKKLRVGQGADWNDVHVFRFNGFNLVTGSSYEGLFKMLIQERFDYFSRGINEALPEYEARKDNLPDLFVEENLLLYYPWPKYFFVPKNNTQLAERIERGLNIMIKDGSFDQLFFKYHQSTIERVNFKKRRIFRLKNPLLPPTAPIKRKELWYTLFEKFKTDN